MDKVAANRLLIARTDSCKGHETDQSVSLSNDKLLAVRFSKLCAFARFCSPEALYRQCNLPTTAVSTLVEKKNMRAYTHIRVHASPRDDTALIEFLDPRRSAWLFITRAIYLRVIPLLRRRRHANRKRGQKSLQKTARDFYPLDKRHWILSIFYVATAITLLYASPLEIFPIRKLSTSIYSWTVLSFAAEQRNKMRKMIF